MPKKEEPQPTPGGKEDKPGEGDEDAPNKEEPKTLESEKSEPNEEIKEKQEVQVEKKIEVTTVVESGKAKEIKIVFAEEGQNPFDQNGQLKITKDNFKEVMQKLNTIADAIIKTLEEKTTPKKE